MENDSTGGDGDGGGAFTVYSPQARDPEPRRKYGLLGSLRASIDGSSEVHVSRRHAPKMAVVMPPTG